MACQLDDIFTALAGISFTVGGHSVDVVTMGDKMVINQTPVRVIVPIGANSEGRSISGLSLGAGLIARWAIADLFLLKPTKRGDGVHSAGADLTAYAMAYVDHFTSRASRELVSPNVTVEDISLSFDVIEYPQNSKKWYFAVTAILSITELME